MLFVPPSALSSTTPMGSTPDSPEALFPRSGATMAELRERRDGRGTIEAIIDALREVDEVTDAIALSMTSGPSRRPELEVCCGRPRLIEDKEHASARGCRLLHSMNPELCRKMTRLLKRILTAKGADLRT